MNIDWVAIIGFFVFVAFCGAWKFLMKKFCFKGKDKIEFSNFKDRVIFTIKVIIFVACTFAALLFIWILMGMPS